MQVGIRELRARLSRFLEAVRAGEEVVITDRGHPVARLVPMGEERPMDRLVAAGLVTPPRAPRRPASTPLIEPRDSVSELVAAPPQRP